MLGQYSKCG